MATSQWSGYGPVTAPPSQQPQTSPEAKVSVTQRSPSGERNKKSQSRQLLSCTKCRERKVKCDRCKPCAACCARGFPNECEFVVGEGNDYQPIPQSYEIRKLRLENQRLRQRLRDAKLVGSAEDDDEGDEDRKGARGTARTSLARQRRFRTNERIDNLYFGTPGLANIVTDFARLQVAKSATQSLTHIMPKAVPRAHDMYVFSGSMYPFPVIAGWTGEDSVGGLVRTLPDQDELFSILDSFQRRAQSCSFPHAQDEVSRAEIERFLDDVEGNAQRYPDMLALIFVTLALGLQMGAYDRAGGQWLAGDMERTTRKADVYLAAGMQALRMASFMSQPTLLGIQSLVMMGPYLTNSGRFLDAWTLFGTTIRMAQSIGLHRNPALLEPSPPLRESMTRRTLWWWILHMDQQYSVTLGRPLGVSGLGDCPPPEPLTTNPTVLRLGEFVNHFTVLARQILGSDSMMSVNKIDEFTDKLVGLWDTMPEALRFNESWAQPTTVLPDWPLEVLSATQFAKVHSFLILLNRQRVERTKGSASSDNSPTATAMRPPPLQRVSSYDQNEPLLHSPPQRGRPLVISSSFLILQTFMFFYHRNPAVLICWTMGQVAFNACMMLIIDALETESNVHIWLVEQVFVVFTELAGKGVHKLAELAVERISDGLAQLKQREKERQRGRSSVAQQQQQQQQWPPQSLFQVDTTPLTDFSNDSVMGSTGMFLLEDPGLQQFIPAPFQPLGWQVAGSPTLASQLSGSTTSGNPSPMIPVSQVTAAPFPVLSSSFLTGTIPVTNSPYAIGLQPRMPTVGGATRRTSYQQQRNQAYAVEIPQAYSTSGPSTAAFTPINPAAQIPQLSPTSIHQPQQQQPFPQPRGRLPTGTGGRPRGVHKLDRVPGRRTQRPA